MRPFPLCITLQKSMEPANSSYVLLSQSSEVSKKMQNQERSDNQASYSCYTCGQTSPQIASLNQHEKLEHPKLIKVCKCSKCPKTFKFNSKLKFHMKLAHNSSCDYICKECCIDFKDSSSLRHHRIDRHANINTKQTCSVCQKLVPLYTLKKHMATHESDHRSEEFFICPECGELFSTNELLGAHVKEAHQPLECSSCLATFKSTYLLAKHRMVQHANGAAKYFTCVQCSMKFVSLSELKQHITHHSDERLNECDVCGFKAKTKSNLYQHKLNKHEVKKSLECSDCPWRFKRETSLLRHQKSHSTVKEYLCEICGVRFKYKSNMHRHARKNQCIAIPEVDTPPEENDITN